MLPHTSHLSKGQRMLLGIIVSSLEEHSQLSTLLGYKRADTEDKTEHDLALTETLMSTLLDNLHRMMLEVLSAVETELSSGSEVQWHVPCVGGNHLYDLLASLQTHLLAFCVSNLHEHESPSMALTQRHLAELLPLASDIYARTASLLTRFPDASYRIHSAVYDSPAGAMLFHTIHCLLLLPIGQVQPLFHQLLLTVRHMDRLNSCLPTPLNNSSEANTPTVESTSPDSWLWLVDLERACSLLAGRCLNGQLVGPPASFEERETLYWLNSGLLSHGLDLSDTDDMGSALKVMAHSLLNKDEQMDLDVFMKMPLHLRNIIEACINATISKGRGKALEDEVPGVFLFAGLQEFAALNDWVTVEDEHRLEMTCNFFLITLAKHCGIHLYNSSKVEEAVLQEVFAFVQQLRQKVISGRGTTRAVDPDDSFYDSNVSTNTQLDESSEGDMSSRCRSVIERCLFLLTVQGPKETGVTGQRSKVEEAVLQEVFAFVQQLRQKVISGRGTTRAVDPDDSFYDSNVSTNTQLDESSEGDMSSRCRSVIERCLFLLTVQGPKETGVAGQSQSDVLDQLRRTCSLALEFVTSESQEGTVLGPSDNPRGIVTSPALLYTAMQHQQLRAEMRFLALNQILELMKTLEGSDSEKSKEEDSAEEKESKEPPVLLNCLHEQLICGCFGLCEEVSISQLSHYLDLIYTAPSTLQEQVTTTVHQIYSIMVSSLRHRLLKLDSYNQEQLQMLTVFVLSLRYRPQDVCHAVDCGLLSVIQDCVVHQSHLTSRDSSLTQAFTQLLHILAVSCVIHSDKLDVSVVESIIQVLHSHLDSLLSLTQPSRQDELASGELRWVEHSLGELLSFTLLSLSNNTKVAWLLASYEWTRSLLSVVGVGTDQLPRLSALTPRLLALQLLTSVLPRRALHTEFRQQIVRELFCQLAANMWEIPQAVAEKQALIREAELDKQLERLTSPMLGEAVFECEVEEDNLPVQDTGFDPEKCLCCSIEGGHTLVHTPGGRGYGLGTTAIYSGCYQWKLLMVKEHKGNEGTCIGVSRWPVKDYGHRTTSDMWLYRAYSGNLYHGGEHNLTLPSFTQGDYITVVLDLDARTLSFGKNGDEPILAFQDIETTTPLYPCVIFYSTNPGEKVKLTDMQVRDSPRDLLPGDPQCAPLPVIMAEAYIHLIRHLHASDAWTSQVNECLMERLGQAKDLLPENTCSGPSVADRQQDTEDNGSSSAPAPDLEQLCKEVWPAMAVIGGQDRGLRVGGHCVEKASGRRASVLGTLKRGLSSVKLLWDDGDGEISDGLLNGLEACEPFPFSCNKLGPVSPDIWLSIIKLTGLTGHLKMPEVSLSPTEWEAVDARRRQSSASHSVVQSVESLTHQMVTSIIGEVTRRGSGDHTIADPSDSSDREFVQQSLTARLANEKLLSCEATAIQVTCVQMSALKTMTTLLSSSQYTELLLVPKSTFSPPSKEEDQNCEGLESTATKEPRDQDEGTLREALRYILRCLVEKAVALCDLPQLASLEELERAFSMLHSEHTRARAHHKHRIDTLEARVRGLNNTRPNSQETSQVVRQQQGPTYLPSLSRMAQKVSPVIPPTKLLPLSLPPLGSPQLEKAMPPPPAKPRHSLHRSPSPPHPLIAAPLLEMGFSLKHVQKAINAIGGSTDIGSTTVNQLATWMIEHPCIESDIIETDSMGSSEQEQCQRYDPSRLYLADDIVGPVGTRRGCGPTRRRPGSDIRSYLADRTELERDRERDREREHVRGEAEPLYLQNTQSLFEIASIQGFGLLGQFVTEPSTLCALCQQTSHQLSSHMTAAHPGCGALSGGSYCGNMVSNKYLLCIECQTEYKRVGNKSENSQNHTWADFLAPTTSYSQETSLVWEEPADVPSLEALYHNFQSPTQSLVSPGGVVRSPDPLGASAVPSVSETTKQNGGSIEGKKAGWVLAEQAAQLKTPQERITALQRVAHAAQVTTARSLVINVLSLLAAR
ncbi:putative E3 ubiquitin-protein ligase herc1 [Homalodisca vitripennis]|nr:putative E3 ubiquitin-protein ligase herc1 [Homalodisca vitripennis]